MSTENIKRLPLWKWLLELIPGAVILTIIYIFSQGLEGIPQPLAKDAALIAAGFLLLVLFMLWTRWFEKQWRWDLLTREPDKNILCGLATGFANFVMITGILYISGCYHAMYASPQWSQIFTNLCVFFLVACGEEAIFRGIIFRMIDERWGLWWALGISALIFGFAHIFNSNATIWSSVAIAVEAGVLLGAAYKYADSLWLPIGFHWAWNFTQGNVFGFAVSGGEGGESILLAETKGPDIITGGAFGPEASIIALILGILISAWFLWKILTRRDSRYQS